ncbi:MAG: InlB B-repeat-containing protein, partial [Candidatus Aceula meridiana]|nr:InlB B-repeat-containing protein [Candidatus Aceula meridiana]
ANSGKARQLLTTTNPDGTYSFSKEYGWSAKVYAEQPGHQFQATNGLMYWEYSELSQNYQNKDYFAVDTFTLTYLAGPGGSISGPTPQIINYGQDGKPVTAVPDTGYHFVNWSDGSVMNPRVDLDVTADITVTANFGIDTLILTYLAGPGGSISGPTPQIINYGQDGKPVTAVPDKGHRFVNWSDGSVKNPRIDFDVTADITVIANFGSNEFKVYGNVEFMPLWDKTGFIKNDAKPIYGEPFIGVEIVVVDPDTNQVIEHLGVYTDEQGYFEFYKPLHWGGTLAIYRPATGQVFGYHTLLGGGYPVIEDLTEDFLVSGPLPQTPSWITGYPGMEPHIKGKVVDLNGNPVEGVLISSVYGPAYSDITDEDGEYDIVYPIFGINDVVHTPESEGFIFSPKDYSYLILDRDFLDQDFVMISEQKNE